MPAQPMPEAAPLTMATLPASRPAPAVDSDDAVMSPPDVVLV
jgi:hypothetical protein